RRLEAGDREGAWARTVETLSALGADLDAAGAVLCPEALPPPEADFLTTQAEAMALVEAVGHPRIRPMLDVKSMCSEAEGPAVLCARYGGSVVHVHANDANRRGPGFGETDFRAIAAALRQSGYDGVVSVEVFDYTPDPATIARESLRCLKESFR
ncbi:MAG: sugar phosphate isomerase/epimerase family protein, partial [Armatimonadota bacterium]